MPTKADPALIRSINADLVLRLCRDAGPISRAEIARRSRLSEPTVSEQVASLIQRGLIREAETGASTRGRRPTLLRFVPDAALAIGVDLDGEAIHVGLVDLTGALIREVRQPLRNRGVGWVSRTISSAVKQLVTRRDAGRLAGIGIAVPGVVRPESHLISHAPSLAWEDVELREPVKAATGLPTWVENRANAAALGEFWCGIGEGLRDLVFVTIRIGIGAGIVLNGEVYRGVSGAAGEIGYMVVDRTSLTQQTDGFGALEALASAWAMVARVRRTRSGGHRSPRSQCTALTPTAIIRAAASGNRRAARAVRETVEALGLAIVNLAAVLNPDLVIIGGSITEGNDQLIGEIRTVVGRLIPAPPQIMSSSLSGKAALLGAASAVFSELYGLGPRFASRLVMGEAARSAR